MSDEVFDALLASLDELRVDRIRVGGGEATLHRSFAPWSEQLAARTKFMSIVTNAQWRTPEPVVRSLVDHYDLVEVSIDAGGADQYEHARPGASFERLEHNLAALLAERERAGSGALVNIRLMLRPSTAGTRAAEVERWGRLADSVMPQFVIEQRHDEVPVDVYLPTQVADRSIPRCTLPFKDLFVRCNGDVPICQVNGTEIEPDARVVLGNVLTDSLSDLWIGERLSAMRAAHRRRPAADLSTIEVCRGCSGR
jgi:MoaA/NifB/PqqE/SkfB family radical SAM enzyme